jgi:hypothetical protein
MAITPGQAAKISEEEESVIREVELAIEDRLRRDYQGHGAVSISEPLERLTDRVRREVLNRFRAAGWSIEKKHYDGDQRDIRERSYDSWEFSAAAPSDPGYTTRYDPSPSWRD